MPEKESSLLIAIFRRVIVREEHDLEPRLWGRLSSVGGVISLGTAVAVTVIMIARRGFLIKVKS